jgi:hypothetical protein
MLEESAESIGHIHGDFVDRLREHQKLSCLLQEVHMREDPSTPHHVLGRQKRYV